MTEMTRGVKVATETSDVVGTSNDDDDETGKKDFEEREEDEIKEMVTDASMVTEVWVEVTAIDDDDDDVTVGTS